MPELAPLIALVGADGSGKSTLLGDVVAHVRKTRKAEAGYLGLGSGPLGERIKAWPLIGPPLERFLSARAKQARTPGARRRQGHSRYCGALFSLGHGTVVLAIALALRPGVRGVYNVTGPGEVPLSAARVVLCGLAPAAHGGNRTGRMFTGDRSGDVLRVFDTSTGAARHRVTVGSVTNPSQALGVLRSRQVHLVVLDTPDTETDGWAALYSELAADHPNTLIVRLGPPGSSTPAGSLQPVVARDEIRTSLGSTVMFSLSRAV